MCVPATACHRIISAAFAAVSKSSSLIFPLPSLSAQEVLVKIYIGQNIRNEGILQSEIGEKKQTETLLSEGLVRENHWYLPQFLTTDKGSQLGKKLVLERIEEREGQFQDRIRGIPKGLWLSSSRDTSILVNLVNSIQVPDTNPQVLRPLSKRSRES